MEAKNATLAVRPVATSPTPRGHTRSRSPAETRNAEGDNPRVSPRTRRITPESKGSVTVKDVHKNRNSRVDPSAATAKEAASLNTQALVHPQRRGKRREEACKRGEDACIASGKYGRRSTATPTATVPSVVYPARKQLAPRKSEIPGRVMAISYPRGVSRVTFTPSNAHVKTPPTTVPASVPARETIPPTGTGPIQEETNFCMEDLEEEDKGGAASSAPTHVTGTVTGDGRWPEAQQDRSTSSEKKSGASETSPPSPSQDCAVPPQSPSPRHCRQPACTFPETMAPPASDHHPTVGMSNTTEVTLADLGGAAPEDGVVGLGSAGGPERLATDTETREGADSASAKGVPPPLTQTASSTGRFSGDDDKPGAEKSTLLGGNIEEAKSDAGHGVEATSEHPGLEEGGGEPDAAAFRPRLVEGVPVLKYGGRGKPKAKMLWVTPDLSEIFYTQAGR